MAKVSLARKKELNEPDELVTASNQAVEYIRENKEKVIGVITAFVLIVVGITGYQLYSGYYENKAFVAFSEDIRWYEATGENTDAKSLKDVKEKSDAFFKKYAGSVAGTLAKAKYADIFYSEGDYNSAVDLYKKLLKAVNGDSALRSMALSGLANSYEALKKYDDAIKTFEEIVEEKSSVKTAEALFHLGILYELQGNKEKSREAFQKIVSYHSDSIYLNVAKEKTAG